MNTVRFNNVTLEVSPNATGGSILSVEPVAGLDFEYLSVEDIDSLCEQVHETHLDKVVERVARRTRARSSIKRIQAQQTFRPHQSGFEQSVFADLQLTV